MSGDSLVLDTNVVIAYLRGTGEVVKFLAEQAEATLVVSVVTRMELLSFPGLTSDEETVVREFLD